MSRSTKIFGLIERDLPGVELCRDMLVVLPTEHILRGFLIETTAERGRVYLWRVVTPLHRPMRSVFLDYSNRIPESGEDVYINSNAYKASADVIRAIISEHLEYLQAVRRPQDFLRHIGRMIGNSSINFRFDLALTYYRVGNVLQCKEILRALDIEVDQLDEKLRMPIDRSIRDAAREIESNPMGFADLLDQWENRNIETLGLQRSRRLSSMPDAVE
jgi:hypothetical protein